MRRTGFGDTAAAERAAWTAAEGPATVAGSTSVAAATAGTAVEAQVVEPFPSVAGPAAPAEAFDIEAAVPAVAAVPWESEQWTAVPFLLLASSWLRDKTKSGRRKGREETLTLAVKR